MSFEANNDINIKQKGQHNPMKYEMSSLILLDTCEQKESNDLNRTLEGKQNQLNLGTPKIDRREATFESESIEKTDNTKMNIDVNSSAECEELSSFDVIESIASLPLSKDVALGDNQEQLLNDIEEKPKERMIFLGQWNTCLSISTLLTVKRKQSYLID